RDFVFEAEHVTYRTAGNHDKIKPRVRGPRSHVAVDEIQPLLSVGWKIQPIFPGSAQHLGLAVETDDIKVQAVAGLGQRNGNSPRPAAQLQDPVRTQFGNQRDIEAYILVVAKLLAVVFFRISLKLTHGLML